MKVSKFRVRIILVTLFVIAVWIRFNAAGEQLYPYYKGESATNYGHAKLIAESGTLPPLVTKMSWPDGYPPSRVGPNGVEYVTGISYRVVSLFSDLSLKEFSGYLSMLILSLCVFPFFSLARHLWYSRAAGVLAAFFVAFSTPLITVTMGREYLHGPYAILLISCHLALFVAYLGRPSTAVLVLSPLLALALAAVWRVADLYLAFFAVLLLLCSGEDTRQRSKLMVAHLVVMLVAGVLLPHLRADRFLLSWPLFIVLTSTVYLFTKRSLPSKIPGWVWVAGGTIILTLLVRPIAGGGIGTLSDVEYWFYRLRFLFGRPDDPLALSDTARFLWTQAHASPLVITLVALFLPFLFLVRETIVALRDIREEHKVVIWPPVALAFVGVILFLIDRTAVTAAALGLFTLAAASARGITRTVRPRIIAVTIACAIMLLQTLALSGGANPTHRIASVFGISPRQADEFLWLSVGNADLDLVRHLTTRTSVVDATLAPPAISSLLVSFAGRTTVLTPGVYTANEMERTNGHMAKFYDHEDELYAVCDAHDIKYVLYTIDLALDRSNYSPRFATGLSHVDEQSLVHKMHFEPETLTHFNLVYENDNYRLFRVTKSMEPVFLTDHPPVYDKSTLRRHAGDYEQFYEAIVDALLTYQLALDAQAQGNDPEAVWRFRYCLGIVPGYTNAWLGVGDSLLRMGDIEAANAAYGRALESSPDNALALYNSALTLVRLGKPVAAQGLLDVLISSSRDRAMVQQARELKTAIDRDMSSDEQEQ
jgi:hypothetical protein